MTESSVALMPPTAGNVPDSAAQSTLKPNGGPVCKNCHTLTTPLWRRSEHGAVLCNACGLFLKLHGRPRPISLKTDVIKSRNRKSAHSATNSTPTMLHQSPADIRKKETKKRKVHDPREINAAETLETILQFEKRSRQMPKLPESQPGDSTPNHGGPAAVGNMHVWRKIIPANQALSPSQLGAAVPPPKTSTPSQASGPLPHLSILLESVKSADDKSQSLAQKIQEIPASSLDPEILKHHMQEQRGLSSPPPQPQPQPQVLTSPKNSGNGGKPSLSNRPSGAVLPSDLSRPLPPTALEWQFEEHDRQALDGGYQNIATQRVNPSRLAGEGNQVPQMHMASINEILNNQKPKNESPGPYTNPLDARRPGSSNASRAQSPGAHNLSFNGPVSQVLRQGNSEERNASQLQSGSQTSNSPPPIDSQTSFAMGVSTSAGSHANLKARTSNEYDAEQQRQRLEHEGARINQHREDAGKVQQRNGIGHSVNADMHISSSRGSRQNSDEAAIPSSASLISLLQGQEEVIKLKTRISELELVTDLYKRHILELDAKCRGFEERLEDCEK
ncbi:LAFA_0B07580g1_1 [Lachancea sp. 'fantastica']|nr:LAFA_0B07580g1_1 [Lachancea sp. 'fantastica']